MPNPAQATPKMVEQVGEQQEHELNLETGEARPLTTQNQAEPSQPASQAGAAAEPAGSPSETQPQPVAQTPTAPAGTPPAPAQPVVEPTPPPVVEVVPPPTPQPATAETPAEVAPAAGAPEAPSEEETAALGRLDTWVTEQREEIAEEARRAVQSQHDRQNAQVERQMQEASTRAQELTNQIRELEMRELTDAEKAKAREAYAQQDERAVLDSYRADLVVAHKSINIDGLLLEFSKYGVQKEALEAIETPEEQELYCEQQKSSALEKQLAAGQVPAQPAAAPVERPPEVPAPPAAQPAATAAPAQPAPAAPPQPNAGVPAGATAPSDVGSGGTVEEGKKFSEESSAGALRENLRNMDWNQVRVRQG